MLAAAAGCCWLLLGAAAAAAAGCCWLLLAADAAVGWQGVRGVVTEGTADEVAF